MVTAVKNRGIKTFSLLVKIAGCLWVIPSHLSAQELYSPKQRIEFLHWIAPQQGQMCGAYQIPADIQSVAHPASSHEHTHITAKGPVVFRRNGVSVLQDHVQLRQSGRLLKADRAELTRNAKTGRWQHIHLQGNVYDYQQNSIVYTNQADLDVATQTFSAKKLLYHMMLGGHPGWLMGKDFVNQNRQKGHINNITLSACSPKHATWWLTARHFSFDKKKNKAVAKHVVLHFWHIPILYTPYFSFPLTRHRKTGFLVPRVGYSTTKGSYLGLPFYWNMAPNYDDLITPTFNFIRKLGLSNVFRYQSWHTHLDFHWASLFHDARFLHDKNKVLSNSAYQSAAYAPYLNELRHDSAWRNRFNLTFSHGFGHRWQLGGQWQRVSDAYFLQDFGNGYNSSTQDQLISHATLSHTGIYWQGQVSALGVQTLHVLGLTVNDQYQRLPEVHIWAQWPDMLPHTDFLWSSQYTNFVMDSQFSPTKVNGGRFNIHPGLRWHWQTPWWRATPSAAWDETFYALSQRQSKSYSLKRGLPILAFDNAFYFTRTMGWGQHHWQQSLEPRITYMYIPYVNQSHIPVFDSIMPVMTYDQLFESERYLGLDRIQDLNRISFGVSSRITRAKDAVMAYPFRFSLGQLISLSRHAHSCQAIIPVPMPCILGCGISAGIL